MREHQIQPPDLMMNHFQQLLQALPSNFEHQALQFQAFQRARKVKSPLQLFKLVMLYCGFDFSLRSCAGMFSLSHGAISDEAMRKRLSSCIDWIKSILNDVLGLQRIHKNGDLKFIVVDGSTVQERGATQISYRLHLAMDLLSLTLTDAVVSTDKVGEKLLHYQIQEGHVILADRGYCRATNIIPVVDQGADVIVRYSPNLMPLYHQDEQGQMTKIDWKETLSLSPNQSQVIEAYMIKGNKRIKGYVHALPRNSIYAAKERRNLSNVAKQEGRKPRELTIYLSGWMLIFTSIPTKILNTADIQSLYKARWQIELSIKRLKSILNIDLLRAKKDSKLAEVYLLGKLLYATLLERVYSQRFENHSVGEFNEGRILSPWRLLHIVHEQVKSGLIAEFPINPSYIQDCLKSLSERSRKRQLQQLTDKIYYIIQLVGCVGEKRSI